MPGSWVFTLHQRLPEIPVGYCKPSSNPQTRGFILLTNSTTFENKGAHIHVEFAPPLPHPSLSDGFLQKLIPLNVVANGQRPFASRLKKKINVQWYQRALNALAICVLHNDWEHVMRQKFIGFMCKMHFFAKGECQLLLTHFATESHWIDTITMCASSILYKVPKVLINCFKLRWSKFFWSENKGAGNVTFCLFLFYFYWFIRHHSVCPGSPNHWLSTQPASQSEVQVITAFRTAGRIRHQRSISNVVMALRATNTAAAAVAQRRSSRHLEKLDDVITLLRLSLWHERSYLV